jgi:hypothetical protein
VDDPRRPDPATLDDEGRWPERIDVRDPAAIELLTDLRGFTFLGPFLHRTHTLSSAAAAIRRAPSSMAHWLPRFVEAGLVERRGEIRRAGAPMPRYRAPARKLVVPFELIPFDARVRLLDEGRLRVLRRFMDGMDEALAASRSFGLSFAAYDDDGSAVQLEETDAARDERQYTDGWLALDLTEADALELSAEIEALYTRYQGRKGPRTYLLHAGLAPDPVFRWRSANDRRP